MAADLFRRDEPPVRRPIRSEFAELDLVRRFLGRDLYRVDARASAACAFGRLGGDSHRCFAVRFYQTLFFHSFDRSRRALLEILGRSPRRRGDLVHAFQVHSHACRRVAGAARAVHLFQLSELSVGVFYARCRTNSCYNDFKRSWDEMDLDPANASESWAAWNRILNGLIKMRVIASLIEDISNRAQVTAASGDPNHGWATLILFYAGPVQLYFNFSGYTDVAIGSAGCWDSNFRRISTGLFSRTT